MKDKYEYLLKSKGEKLRKFVDEYEEYKAASVEDHPQISHMDQMKHPLAERIIT